MSGGGLRPRLKSQGFFKTAWYVFTVFLLPRIGVDIKSAYHKTDEYHPPRTRLNDDIKLEKVQNYDQIQETDLDRLRAFEGDELLERIQRDLAKGITCALCKNTAGELVGVQWVAPRETKNPDEHNYLFCGSFIFPEFRGLSYSPSLKIHYYKSLKEELNARQLTITANIHIGNTASIRSVKKAGFHYHHTILQLFGRHSFIIHRA